MFTLSSEGRAEVLKELNETYKATKKDDKVATKEEEKK